MHQIPGFYENEGATKGTFSSDSMHTKQQITFVDLIQISEHQQFDDEEVLDTLCQLCHEDKETGSKFALALDTD